MAHRVIISRLRAAGRLSYARQQQTAAAWAWARADESPLITSFRPFGTSSLLSSSQQSQSQQGGSGAFDVTNPYTEETIATMEADDDLAVIGKFLRAGKAQRDWAAVGVAERVKLLHTFADKLSDEADVLAATLTSETGKPLRDAKAEVRATAGRVKHLADTALEVMKPQQFASSGGKLVERVEYEPLGVVANITTWNYPFFVAANVFAAALATGNAVLMKPSEVTPLSGAAIARLLHAAGVPKDVFQVCQGGPATGQALASLHGLGAICFTGSRAAGRWVAAAAAAHAATDHYVPHLQLELGGKDAVYVRADADVEKAAAAVASGAFHNAGQNCCSVERVYVHEAVAQPFFEALVEVAKALRMGDPTDPSTSLGPLARRENVRFIARQLDEAMSEEGVKVLHHDPASTPSRGFFAAPAIVDVTGAPDAGERLSLMREESFGPVVGVAVVPGDEEAAAAMANSVYGLTAGVFTADEDVALAFIRGLDVGTGYWNECNRVSSRLPWSGRKGSGRGATLGVDGVRGFVRPKSLHLRLPA